MSGSRSSSSNVNMASTWSKREEKLFEVALARYGEDTPDRWNKVSREMGGTKTADEVRRKYEILDEEVKLIESGQVPFPRSEACEEPPNRHYCYMK